MLYEVALHASWYRYADSANSKEILARGVDYCTVMVEADSDWEARHRAISLAAERYRAHWHEAYWGDSRITGHSVRLAPAKSQAGTVSPLSPDRPAWTF
jgi:hypothetical protein